MKHIRALGAAAFIFRVLTLSTHVNYALKKKKNVTSHARPGIISRPVPRVDDSINTF